MMMMMMMMSKAQNFPRQKDGHSAAGVGFSPAFRGVANERSF